MPYDRQKLFLEGPIGTALVRLAIPIILGNLLQTGYQLTDAFWVGRLGAAAVAAVAVSFPVTFLVIALGSGLAMAGATLSAQYMGAGRQDMVNHVAAQTMVMVAITSVILGTAGYLLSPSLLTLLGVASDVYDGALGFMRVSFIGIIFVFLYAMFQALMRGIGQTRVPLLIVLGTVGLNFVLDPLFIFGWGSLPSQGVMGAALATLITQALAALLGVVIFLRGRHGIQLSWSGFRPDLLYLKRAFLSWISGLGRIIHARTWHDDHVVSGREFWYSDTGCLWCRIQYTAGRNHSCDGSFHGRFDPGRAEYRCGKHPARCTGKCSRYLFRFCHSHTGRTRRLCFRTGDR
jgi:Na+-driven multidrug efflux pump